MLIAYETKIVCFRELFFFFSSNIFSLILFKIALLRKTQAILHKDQMQDLQYFLYFFSHYVNI